MGFALRVLGGRLASGARWWADRAALGPRLAGADLAVTGEGRLDVQTLMGKVPHVVLESAKTLGKRVVMVAGEVPDDPAPFYEAGAWLVLSLSAGPQTRQQALKSAEQRLLRTGETLGRMLRYGGAAT
jgi:glycerate kinase